MSSSRCLRLALVGNPNCGKTSLFNALTGGKARVGNYPGVTVEKKEGVLVSASGLNLQLLDLPGAYSLDPRTPDEEITRSVLLEAQEKAPDLLIAVADANHLERTLGFILELKSLGKPMVLALNMMDLAQKRGFQIRLDLLSQELGMPVIPTVATKKEGLIELLKQLDENCLSLLSSQSSLSSSLSSPPSSSAAPSSQLRSNQDGDLSSLNASHTDQIRARFTEVDRILKQALLRAPSPALWSDRMDRVLLHPVYGSLILILIFGLLFQAVFSWAEMPKEWIEEGFHTLALTLGQWLPDGPLRSLIVDGVMTGVGSVLAFLPQILLLFSFILFLEDSGYLPRAAFMMDRVMGKVGLHGRAFIPLLSSFACAIPGIMATRTIENRRDRLTTILVAPLMTCSARLPIYTLLISAFIPNTQILGVFRLQGLVLLSLYVFGVFAALAVAFILKRVVFPGPRPALLLELPTYKWPSFKGIGIGLWERCQLFVKNAGTVILSITVILWFLSSYPKPPQGAEGPAIAYSFAGQIGHALEPLVAPIGFDWRIAVALIPGFAAREVMIGSLATVYAVEDQAQSLGVSQFLGERLSQQWSVATALSLIVWYVLACQCLSTLAVTRRETNSWKWPMVMLSYMTALAYASSYVTYHVAVGLGLG